jgi:hypothetical protein
VTVGLRTYWTEVRRWVDLGTEWVERMWLRDDKAGRRGAGEHRWAWIWLGKDASDGDIDELVRQVHEEIVRLPVPLGIGDFMVTVTAWGPRHDGAGEGYYLTARQAGDEVAQREDLATRQPPKVVAVGDAARGHVISQRDWTLSARDQLRRILQRCRPSRQWRIVQVSLFSVGEAYLKLMTRPANRD